MVFHVCVLLECCWRIMCWNWWFWFVCWAAKFCFAAATEPPAANWYSLLIYVLRNKILFRCRNWTSCSELIFAADLCVAQRNPQLNLLQRSDIRCRFVCCAAKFCFVAATEPAAANWYLLPICVLRSEILFRCRNWTCCSEVIFTAELCVMQRNCGANSDAVFVAELAACGEPVLAAEMGSPQRTSSRCRFL